jgi:predicted nucleotidyltransferase
MSKVLRHELTRQAILTRLADNGALLQKFHVRRIGLFGSYARQEQTKQSDIDLLVEFESASFDNFMNLAFAHAGKSESVSETPGGAGGLLA